MVVGDALVDVDADLARPVDELDGQTFEKLFRTQLKKKWEDIYKRAAILNGTDRQRYEEKVQVARWVVKIVKLNLIFLISWLNGFDSRLCPLFKKNAMI